MVVGDEAGRPEVLLIPGGKEEGVGKRAREEEQAQRNANGRAGLDMQRKKYLRPRTVEHCVKAEARLSEKRGMTRGGREG